jgi:hypothetical protein
MYLNKDSTPHEVTAAAMKLIVEFEEFEKFIKEWIYNNKSEMYLERHIIQAKGELEQVAIKLVEKHMVEAQDAKIVIEQEESTDSSV